MIAFHSVNKVFCRNPVLSKRQGFADVFRRTRPPNGSLRRGEFRALKGVSFGLKRGDVLWLIGTPNSGKTTIGKLMYGLYRPDGGEVKREGSVRFVSGVMLPLVMGMNLHQNVRTVLALLDVPYRDLARRTFEVLELMGMQDKSKVKLHELQEKLRLNFNRLVPYCASIAADADVYFFDGRQAKGPADMLERICARSEAIFETRTAVVSTDDAVPPSQKVTKAALLHKGEILWQGLPEEAAAKYKELIVETGEEERLGEAVPDDDDVLDDDEEDYG